MFKKLEPIEPTTEGLAKALNMDDDFIRAAGLSDDKKQEYATSLNKSAKIDKWLVVPAAFVALVALFGSSFLKDKHGDAPTPVNVAFAVAVIGYVGGRMMDKKGKIESHVRNTADANLLEFYRKNNTPAP